MHIVYVEDELRHFNSVEKALNDRNDGASTHEPITISRAATPDELTEELLAKADVVLADVYYREKGVSRPRLGDIITEVKRHEEHAARDGRSRKLPVIAYTARGTLAECLVYRDDLFDVWNKETADPAYVAWRMEELARTLDRVQPDRYLQKVVASCDSVPPPFATLIPRMLQLYSDRWSEADQIDQTGDAVEEILSQRRMLEPLRDLWRTMSNWEMLGRAVSRTMRGHARHVYNVYWVGYAILNRLMPHFEQLWLRANPGVAALENQSPALSLNMTWFYAALFHDTAYCVEELHRVVHTVGDLIDVFKGLSNFSSDHSLATTTRSDAEQLFVRLDPAVVVELLTLIDESLASDRPDHGVIGALRLKQLTRGSAEEALASIAAEAIALHNVLSKYAGAASAIDWEKHPIACLLLIADQLQTWDRQRGDATLVEPRSDMSERAELAAFDVVDGLPPKVCLTVRYITPPHLRLSPFAFARERKRLQKILREKPRETLGKIGLEGWPFQLEVQALLDNTQLETKIFFPMDPIHDAAPPVVAAT